MVGRLTADPELKALQSGSNVVNFSLATSRKWKDKNGQQAEDTEFHRIVAFGKLAEIISQYCVKGSLLLVEGRLKTRKWETKTGEKRQTTEVMAESIQLGPKPQGQTKTSARQADAAADIGIDQDPGPAASELPF